MPHYESKELHLRPAHEDPRAFSSARSGGHHFTWKTFDRVIRDVCNERDDWLPDEICETDEDKLEPILCRNLT